MQTITSSRFLLSATERVKRTRSNGLKFRLVAALFRAQNLKSTCRKESNDKALDANEEIELDDGTQDETDQDAEYDLV